VSDRQNGAARPERLLRFPSVQQRVPYSHSTIYLLIKEGRFPKPVFLGGRAVAWRESEIDQWIAGLSSEACAK
jgi:prophage regulatory protein